MDKNERLTCTPHSKQEYEMVQLLADLSGNTLSYIVGQALHEYLKNNFVSEIIDSVSPKQQQDSKT